MTFLIIKRGEISHSREKVTTKLVNEILEVDKSQRFGEANDLSDQSFSDIGIATYVNFQVQKDCAELQSQWKDWRKFPLLHPTCFTPRGQPLYGTVVITARYVLFDEYDLEPEIFDNSPDGLSLAQVEIIKKELILTKGLTEQQKMYIDLAFSGGN